MNGRKLDRLPEAQFKRIKNELRKECPTAALPIIKIAKKYNIDINDIFDLFLIVFEDETKTMMICFERDRERIKKMNIAELLQYVASWIDKRGYFK